MTFTFYLGAHHPNWLGDDRFADVPLCVSRARLVGRKTFPRAKGRWLFDSGGFSEIKQHGRWRVTATHYVAEIRRIIDGVGMPDFVAPMDWMCEEEVIQGRRDVEPGPKWYHGTREARGIPEGEPDESLDAATFKHQTWTVENFVLVRALAPELPVFPVLQGSDVPTYRRCADMYAAAGVDLGAEPLVGLGSVCRLQSTTKIVAIVTEFASRGWNLHGFGVKTKGLAQIGGLLRSADSMAWSRAAMKLPPLPGHEVRHKNCANCPEFALMWRDRLLGELAKLRPTTESPWYQPSLDEAA